MRAKIGDVVIDKTYNKKGNLAIVVGEGISQPILIYHNGGIARDKLRDYFAVWDGLEVIGHIDFEKVWEEAVLTADCKTENSSEKPNNCELQTIRCPKCGRTDYIRDMEKDMGIKDSYYKYKCINCNFYIKTEPTISKMEQVEDEPQTERSSE